MGSNWNPWHSSQTGFKNTKVSTFWAGQCGPRVEPLKAFRPGPAQVWEDGPLRIWEHWLLGSSIIIITSEACSLLQFTRKITLPLKMAWHHHSPRIGIRATSVPILSTLGPQHTSWVTSDTQFPQCLPGWEVDHLHTHCLFGCGSRCISLPFWNRNLIMAKCHRCKFFKCTLLGTFPRS